MSDNLGCVVGQCSNELLRSEGLISVTGHKFARSFILGMGIVIRMPTIQKVLV